MTTVTRVSQEAIALPHSHGHRRSSGQLAGGDATQTALMSGLLPTVWSLMQFPLSPLVGALSDRFGRWPVLILKRSSLLPRFRQRIARIAFRARSSPRSYCATSLVGC